MKRQNDYYLTLTTNGKQTRHFLSTDQATVIGRESSCQIVLDSINYKGVSRRHVEIRPLVSRTSNGSPVWRCDSKRTKNNTGRIIRIIQLNFSVVYEEV